ncbi:MAG: MFS transporter [Chloroflexi bacterium]|nr:MFS transporter [Chloroflexota bacterium]
MLVVLISTGLLQALLGGVSALPVVFLTMAGLGFTGAITLTMNNTLLQTIVDDEYRGRVMSLYFISFGIQPIGALVAGRIAESWGLQPTLVGTGALVAAGMFVVSLLARRVRDL